jgi:DNA-binding response OmpR family regulator
MSGAAPIVCPKCGHLLAPTKWLVEVDEVEGVARAGDAAVKVTAAEAEIPGTLAAGTPVTNGRLWEALYSAPCRRGGEPAIRNVSVHICHLRKVVGVLGLEIETLRGFGYRLRPIAGDGCAA